MVKEPIEQESASVLPHDAFAVLGNETRIAIIQAMWEAYDLEASDNTVLFSELYDRVDHDDTGNFNYHLGKLTGHFVRQTETGYELSSVGLRIAQSVIAGTIGEGPRIGPTEIDADCPLCGASVEITYERQYLHARCTRCTGLWPGNEGTKGKLFRFSLPPVGVADRTPEEAFHAAVTHFLNGVRSYRNGVCSSCSGVVDERVDVCESHAPGEDGTCPNCNRHHMIEVTALCGQCKRGVTGPLTIAVLLEPSVTEFYREHGVDHRFESWETFKRSMAIDEVLVATDPVRMRLTVPCEDDRLQLTLDETATVLDVDR
ncbi:MAG: DUF7351 domain-containing protein [Halobacteriota archaeon]